MRNAFPLLILLLAGVGGYWLLVPGDDLAPADGTLPPPESGVRAAEDPPSAMTAAPPPGAGGLEAKGAAPVPSRKVVARAADPRTWPTVTLAVRVLGPDLTPMPSKNLQVFVERGTRGTWPTLLGHYDEARRAWIFADVVAGAVRIRLRGKNIVPKEVDADLPSGREAVVDVDVDLAGAIRFEVIAYDKTRPRPVQLTVYDWRDRPVEAWYEERTPERATVPRKLRTASIGPGGLIFGLLPGRYRLRVVSPNEESDEARVDVEAGKTTTVSLEVRR